MPIPIIQNPAKLFGKPSSENGEDNFNGSYVRNILNEWWEKTAVPVIDLLGSQKADHWNGNHFDISSKMDKQQVATVLACSLIKAGWSSLDAVAEHSINLAKKICEGVKE